MDTAGWMRNRMGYTLGLRASNSVLERGFYRCCEEPCGVLDARL
jgi:hypothetical protein